MYVPPPHSNLPPEYWKHETEYRRNKLSNFGLTGELLTLLWYLVKWVMLVVTFPVRLIIARWRKQSQRRKLKAKERPPYEIR